MTAPVSEARPAARTYVGWQRERVAFMLGLSGQRAVMLAAAVLCGIWPLAVSRVSLIALTWPAGLVLALAALVRVAGRTLDEWALAAISYTLVRFQGQHRFFSGAFAPMSAAKPIGPAPMDLPGVLAPVRILAAGPQGQLGVVHHRHDGTYTAVARIRTPGIGLIDSARRDARVSGWGQLLAGLCAEGSPITRIQTLHRLVPESGTALRSWHAEHVACDAPPVALAVTSGLLATSTLATSRREAYLAVVMDERRAARAVKAIGRGPVAATAVLVRHLRALGPAMSSADLTVEAWLGPREVAEVIRTAYDPHAARSLAERRALAADPHRAGLAAGITSGVAGPTAAVALPGSYRHDGAVSVTYWVYDWPRTQVYATVLAPLVGDGAHRRALSMHIEPLPPRVAERAVMRERTARDVAVRMRQRTGQVVPEDERVALQRAQEQDAERAAGHSLARFSGYLTVTVTDPDRLEDACAEVEADAAAARIELRRMWMAQDVGFACGALPLGIGLPRRRW